jgi:hypothetical protein
MAGSGFERMGSLLPQVVPGRPVYDRHHRRVGDVVQVCPGRSGIPEDVALAKGLPPPAARQRATRPGRVPDDVTGSSRSPQGRPAHTAPGTPDFLDQGLEPRLAARGNDDFRPPRREAQRRLAPDPTRCPDDDNDLPLDRF